MQGEPPIPPAGGGGLLKTLARPVEGHLFGSVLLMPLRSHRPTSQQRLLKTYAQEAARLRNLAASVTTAPLRSRLLEEADHQEQLAQAIRPSLSRIERPTSVIANPARAMLISS